MRSNEVFARMTPEQVEAFLADVKRDAPEVAHLAMGAAASSFRLRPTFLKRQPRARQAGWVRRALARGGSASIAEDVLATYFLGHRLELLVELLDALGLEHDEGTLKDESPACPPVETLESTVARFRSGDEPAKRELLLQAFAAQSAIDWPELDALLGFGSGS